MCSASTKVALIKKVSVLLLTWVLATISDLPIPAINIIRDGNSVAGENYTLICTVTVVDGLADDVVFAVSWADSNGDPVQSDSMQRDGVNTTLILEFDPLLSSHGGQYTCNASITVPAISTVRRNSEPHDIIIQSNNNRLSLYCLITIMHLLPVPSPNVEVSTSQLEPYLAGMLAELHCSITIDDSIDTPVDVAAVWQRNGEEVTETLRVQTLRPHLEQGLQYDALLQFSTLSSSTDSGNYLCISTVLPRDENVYILNSTQSASFSLIVTGTYIIMLT